MSHKNHLDRKSQAGRIENRIIGEIENRDRRRTLTAEWRVSDLRTLWRTLESRSVGILSRLDRDPVLRALAEQEAARCRKLAMKIAVMLEGGAV